MSGEELPVEGGIQEEALIHLCRMVYRMCMRWGWASSLESGSHRLLWTGETSAVQPGRSIPGSSTRPHPHPPPRVLLYFGDRRCALQPAVHVLRAGWGAGSRIRTASRGMCRGRRRRAGAVKLAGSLLLRLSLSRPMAVVSAGNGDFRHILQL